MARGKNWATRHTEEFKQELLNKCSLDESTGDVKFDGIYASLYVSIQWRSHSIAVPYSHLVFFLKNKRWPITGMHLDHIDNDPWNNRPDNLEELTIKENQSKKKYRKIYSSYGKGKYGHGISIYKRKDNIFYVERSISRAEAKEDGKKLWLGSANTKEKAEDIAEFYIKNNYNLELTREKFKYKRGPKSKYKYGIYVSERKNGIFTVDQSIKLEEGGYTAIRISTVHSREEADRVAQNKSDELSKVDFADFMNENLDKPAA